ncbi:trypsin-like serine peptidase [Oceaniglobus trochenteri]|uniref:trypsin-like serine peptidase n=1 Tax=Oceaniglobus trochenteri TaxID=2763260 RepID=UPI001CFFD11A|nr:trypsin-like peptidase domain-containing protein [Oceaniglobus trochenteri]
MRALACRGLLALVLGLLAHGPAPVLAGDSGLKRLTLRSEGLGWEAVGRVDLGGRGFCSGVLIAPDLVLTAGHCLFDRAQGTARDLGALRFRAGLRDGLAVAERGVKRAVVHPLYAEATTGRAGQIRYDLALLELETPIPAATAAPFLVERLPARGQEVSVVSYAEGRASALSLQRRCGVLDSRDRLTMLSCDVTFGASGAPVFDLSGRRARIVSIISSGGEYRGRQVAYGMDIPPALAELKSALTTGRGVILARDAVARRVMPRADHRAQGARFLKARRRD